MINHSIGPFDPTQAQAYYNTLVVIANFPVTAVGDETQAVIGTLMQVQHAAREATHGRGPEELPPSETPEQRASKCGNCGGPYRFDTTVPSELWNLVIRATGGSEYLCATCIIEAFARAGVSFTAELWSEEFNGVPVSVTVSQPPSETPQEPR